MGVYSFSANTIQGEEVGLDRYRGQVALIVNTASKCGLTPQYEGLEQLYQKYKDRGLVILGFPCNQFGAQEPGSNAEVEQFCQVNYGVSFPLFEKIDVNGEAKHPLYAYLTEEKAFEGFDQTQPSGQKFHAMFANNMPDKLLDNDIKWNFTKFLVDRDGQVVARFEPPVLPEEIAPEIEKLL